MFDLDKVPHSKRLGSEGYLGQDPSLLSEMIFLILLNNILSISSK
ncbi:MAG: hypothetical protein ACI9YH_004663 [Colwellia sp.]|jgi:hypothetical protein